MSNHGMVTNSSQPQPDQQQNADNSNNISNPPEAARPHAPNGHQELQDAFDGTGPTMPGSPNERQMPQHPLNDATFIVPASPDQRPTLQTAFCSCSPNERQMPQHPVDDATFTVPAEQRPTLQSNFHNAPGFPYFATFQYPWYNPTGATCFPVVQTPTMNATQPTGAFLFMLAFLPVAPVAPTTIQTEVPRHPTQFRNGPDEMSPPTTVLPQHMTQGPQSNVSATTHRGQSHLSISGSMGSHGPQASENNSVPHAFPSGISANASRGRTPNTGTNDFPHSFYGNDGISMMTDLSRISQDRNLSNLPGTQYYGISQNTHLGQRQGNILTSTYSVNHPSSHLESTHLNHQRSGSSAHNTPNINMSPTTYFGQHLGNISSMIDSYRHPYSSPSGHLPSDVFASPGTYISQRPGDISSITSYQHPIEHNSTHHNLQSNGPAGFDIQNSGIRSTNNTGKNVTNVGNAYFSGHVGEVSSITDPINYSISSTTCPPNGFLTWAPGATSTPISSGKILTSGKRQTADHHMNAAAGRSMPSYPAMKTGVQLKFAPKEMQSSGPARVAMVRTLPPEAIREEELRDEMSCACDSQTSWQKIMPTTEGKFWCFYLIMTGVKTSEVFIKGRW
jgi:hypothetical protein